MSLAFLPDGTLLSGSFDGELQRWSPGDSRRIAGVVTRAGPVANITRMPRERGVLTSSLTSGDLLERSAEGLVV